MRKALISLMLFFCLNAVAQQNYQAPEDTKVEMADKLRSEGKIYVVVAVMSTVLIGMIGYLIIIDRRIGKMEKELQD